MIKDFIIISSTGLVMIFITSLIIYEIFGCVWKILPRLDLSKRLRVPFVIVPIFTAHILNIWLYALIYLMIAHATSMGLIAGSAISGLGKGVSFYDYLYFSAVTYTTVGFGDIVATGMLRMLAATEALNGLVLMGWTISFTYLAMEDYWKTTDKDSRSVD